jgi:hypothetical protein
LIKEGTINVETSTTNMIKRAEILMCIGALITLAIIAFNVFSMWVSQDNFANVGIETQNFLDNCSKTGTIDKESFNKLCETAKENKMEIKMGVNSRKLTIDQNNQPESLYFSNKDTIIILATGVGRTFIETFKHDPINGQPVKNYKFANMV